MNHYVPFATLFKVASMCGGRYRKKRRETKRGREIGGYDSQEKESE